MTETAGTASLSGLVSGFVPLIASDERSWSTAMLLLALITAAGGFFDLARPDASA